MTKGDSPVRRDELVRSPAMTWGAVLLLPTVVPASGSQAQEEWKTDFTKLAVPWDELVSGGPPKDGIPAIDDPTFQSIREADEWLEDREPVAVVRVGSSAKAYPLQILMWHEIVNDHVGDTPISVTFCPLCNTTLAFDRRFGDLLLDFGTTGRLRHSDLVMYDRQTETWWQQATGEGIVGEHAGERLTFVPAPVLSWEDVKEQVPNAQVLSRDTGHRRSYGRNPYAGYDRQPGPIRRFFSAKEDERLPAMERVVSLESENNYLAVPFSELSESRVANVTVGSQRLVVFWAPGVASALDDARISAGRDVGASAVFTPAAGGRNLTFEPAVDGRFRDRETRSEWNLSGLAVTGELAGTQLAEEPHGNHFWFAWGVFRPETEIWRAR